MSSIHWNHWPTCVTIQRIIHIQHKRTKFLSKGIAANKSATAWRFDVLNCLTFTIDFYKKFGRKGKNPGRWYPPPLERPKVDFYLGHLRVDETLQKCSNRYFNSYKVFASGDFIPQFPSSAKLLECEQTWLIVYCLRTDSVSGGSRGATGGHGPPKRWTNFFFTLSITNHW